MWELTFNELTSRIGARRERETLNLRMLAWYTVMLGRQKRVPSLDKWLNPPKRITQREHDAMGKRARETAAKLGLRIIE